MEFGEYLKNTRKEKGLSMRELAKKSDVSQAYISQIENGKRNTPNIEVIKKLSKGLNIPYIPLLHKAGYIDELKEYVKSVEMPKRFVKSLYDIDLDIEDGESSFLIKPGFVDTIDPVKRIFLPAKFNLDGKTKDFVNSDFLNLYNLISIAIDKNNFLPFTNSKGEKIEVEELEKLLPIIKSLYN